MAERDAVFPANPHALFERHRYSPAIRSGGFLFISGQVGAREDGTPEEELEAEVARAFDNLNAILAAASCSFADVVDVTVFIVDPEANFERAFPVIGRYWGEPPYPNITAVGATWLAGFRFEIKAIAKLRDADHG